MSEAVITSLIAPPGKVYENHVQKYEPATLSQRGERYANTMSPLMGKLLKLIGNPWSLHNPQGFISLGIAENSLMQTDLVEVG